MKPSAAVMILTSLVLTLTACSSTPEPTNPLELVPGTYNITGVENPTTTFLVLLTDVALPAEEVTLSFTGPAGWNNGEPITLTRTRDNFSDGSTSSVTPANAVSGIYNVTVTSGAAQYQASATLDASSLLPAPQNVIVTSQSANQVSATWDPVPGAVSYQAFMRENPNEFNSPGIAGDYVTGTSATLSNLNLEPGEYRVEVIAYPVDFATDAPIVDPGRFNLSYNRSARFTVE